MKAAAIFTLRYLLVLLGAALVVINILVAPTQMAEIGFAAGPREPNELARLFNYVVAVASAGVAVWAISAKNLFYPTYAISALLVATVYLYFQSW